MARARINGGEINFEVLGRGCRLLFVNGSGSTIASVRPLLRILSRAFEVAVADSRGLGLSPAPDHPYAMADLAADAIGLADHLGWDRFRLMASASAAWWLRRSR